MIYILYLFIFLSTNRFFFFGFALPSFFSISFSILPTFSLFPFHLHPSSPPFLSSSPHYFLSYHLSFLYPFHLISMFSNFSFSPSIYFRSYQSSFSFQLYFLITSSFFLPLHRFSVSPFILLLRFFFFPYHIFSYPANLFSLAFQLYFFILPLILSSSPYLFPSYQASFSLSLSVGPLHRCFSPSFLFFPFTGFRCQLPGKPRRNISSLYLERERRTQGITFFFIYYRCKKIYGHTGSILLFSN